MEINVLMLTDRNYISQAKVAMYSACQNTDPETKIIFTILCDEDLDKTSRERLIALQKIFPNISVCFYEVETEEVLRAKSDYRVPKVSYYRLIGAKALDVEKAICLDSDLIVGMDLAELYAIDIEDYYIAGVRDLHTISHPNFALWYADNYNLKNFSNYINCGVLLMNLKRIREEHIVEAFLEELNHRNLWLDQDILNRVCVGKIRRIDWKFNHVAHFTNEEYEWNCGPIEEKSTKEIVHFCGPNKPWENRYLCMADRWWDVAKMALEEDIYEKLYRVASIGYGSERIADIAVRCKETGIVIIVGYSDHGIFVRNALLRYGIAAEIFFCDNDRKKRELMLTDEKIYTPEEAATRYKDALWINVVQKQREEIVSQLRRLNIPNECIVNYMYE
jgi:lipopolysaccharide biosynthesis glycosyltransferase